MHVTEYCCIFVAHAKKRERPISGLATCEKHVVTMTVSVLDPMEIVPMESVSLSSLHTCLSYSYILVYTWPSKSRCALEGRHVANSVPVSDLAS